MIKVTNINKIFDGRKVVDGVTFQINKGEIVALLGPNGAGKTTTIRMIAGTLPPSSGEILIGGKNLFTGHDEEKANIGYLPENNPLYDFFTVQEYLDFWLRLKNSHQIKSTEAIGSLLEQLGLTEVFYQPINQLSKGFRQRVGLAQALLGQPKILLLDEPTEGLDPNQRREIESLIVGFGKERTIIICSHVLSEVTKICQRVIIINRGKVVADDQVSNLISGDKNRQIITITAEGQNIKANLEQLKGVASVTFQEGSDSAQQTFTIEARSDSDPRSSIFDLAKDKGWRLLELKLIQTSLEDVFADLTK